MAFDPRTENHWYYFLFKKRLPISLYIIIPFVVSLIAFSSGFIALVLFEYFLIDNSVLSLAPFMEPKINELLRWTKLEILGFTFLGGLAGVGIVFAILNPLRKVLMGARQIADGDFSSRLDIKGLDKLGILGKDFNLMVSSLNEYFIDNMAGGWILLDTQGKILSVNRGALNILQCESHDLIDSHHSVLLNILKTDALLKGWIEESVQNQVENSIKELRAIDAEGRNLKLSISTSRLKDNDDNFVGMALTLKDLTRATEITEKMQRADKLAALGGMAAGLAHEIRNPLGSIKGLTQLLGEELKDGEKAKTYTETMIREIDRLNGVSQELTPNMFPSSTLVSSEIARKQIQKIYMASGKRRTFHCGCIFDKLKQVFPNICENSSSPVLKKSTPKKLAWLSLMPPSTFGESLKCWNKTLCAHSKGENVKGAQCCSEISPKFKIMQSDMHNIFPMFKEPDGYTGKNDFNGMWGYNYCKNDLENIVRKEVRGDASRAYLYMSFQYKIPLEENFENSMRMWHFEDPPSEWEEKRNDLIEIVQGNRNPFIDQPELVERVADF
jgi:PAS domain S-box-containing protein